MSVVAFEAIMAYGDKNIFSFLFESVLDKEHKEKEIRMVSVIVKIKMLKQIVLLDEKLPGQLKPLINTRLEHIKSLHLEILNYLNQNPKNNHEKNRRINS